MHITKHTDYALRTLMYLALQGHGNIVKISDVSGAFDISNSHVMKVVNRLGSLGLITTTRGRSGGIELGKPADQINVGEVFRALEPTGQLVDCGTGPCRFAGDCEFDQALTLASDAFVDTLSQYTLSDLVRRKTKLMRLLRH